MGAARPITDSASRYTTADKPEVIVTCSGQELTTSFPIQNTQNAPAHTGSQQCFISSDDRSSTSSDISSAETSMPPMFYYGDVPITGSAAHARAFVGDIAFMHMSAAARDAPSSVEEGAVDVFSPWVNHPLPCDRTVSSMVYTGI